MLCDLEYGIQVSVKKSVMLPAREEWEFPSGRRREGSFNSFLLKLGACLGQENFQRDIFFDVIERKEFMWLSTLPLLGKEFQHPPALHQVKTDWMIVLKTELHTFFNKWIHRYSRVWKYLYFRFYFNFHWFPVCHCDFRKINRKIKNFRRILVQNRNEIHLPG